MHTKKSAEYKEKTKIKKCENCKHYRNYDCTLVIGKISPNGTCRYWRK